MMAAQFVEVGAPLRLVDVARPIPAANETLVAVRAVGLCGSDLHILSGHTPTSAPPITLGHEIAGTVAELGIGASGDLSVGDHAFVNPMVGCGTCSACRSGDAASCADLRILGIHLPGGLAEFVVVPTRNVTVLPRHIPVPEIALIESAGTANRALRLLGTGPSTNVLVIGTGGLGMQAVRLARAMGARVVTIDRDPVARRRSIDAGASAALSPDEPLESVVADVTDDALGFDGVVDCVGAPTTITVALRALRRGGRVAVVGIGESSAVLTPPSHFIRRGLQVLGVYGYSDVDIAQVIGRVVDGSLDLSTTAIEKVALADVDEGIRRFHSRENAPTRVIVEIA